MPRVLYIVSISLACAIGLAACSFAPNAMTPETEEELPNTYAQVPDTTLPAYATDTVRYDQTRWWTSLDNPSLNTLIDSALAANLNLRLAELRVDELRARFRIARAPLFPSATVNAEGTRQSQPANTGIGGAIGGGGGRDGGDNGGGEQPTGGTPDRFSFTTYSASLGVSYELDFWGRIRNSKNAALSEFFASEADLQTARISVISQVISTYYEMGALAEQVRLGKASIDVLQERLELTEDRYERGLVNSFELYAIRQDFESAQSNQAPLESQLYEAKGRFAILLALFAGQERVLLDDTLDTSVDLSDVPAGLPSELLMQRPDVRAEAALLEAARYRIGVARANLLPSFSLTGQGGVQSSTLDDLINYDQRFTNLIASLTAPLFQGGRLWAEVDVSKTQYEQQVATYERTLLTAFKEVKASLVAYDKERRRYALVQGQLASAQASATNQQRRFERGIGDYLAFLDAQRNLIQVQTRLATARQAVVNARLALHRALGGRWTDDELS